VNHPEENIQLSKYGEILKSRINLVNKICSEKYKESFSELCHYSENAVQFCWVRICIKTGHLNIP
jgi:hypothetical protein